MIFSKIFEVRGTKMTKIQKNAARFDNLKQDFLDDKKYSGTAEATLNGYRYDITRFLKFLSDEQLTIIGVTAHSGYTVKHDGNIFTLVPGFLCRIQKFLKLWPVQLCSGECFLVEPCFGVLCKDVPHLPFNALLFGTDSAIAVNHHHLLFFCQF